MSGTAAETGRAGTTSFAEMGVAVAAAVEAALDAALRLDPAARDHLAPLAGRVLRLELDGLGLGLTLRVTGEAILVQRHGGPEPEAVIRGTPFALLELARTPRAGGAAGVHFSGDTALARDFQHLLARLRPDWEEALSRVLGDAAAHYAGRALSGLAAWAAEAGAALVADLGHYLQAESGLAPASDEVEGFLDAVDRLRADTERLAVRVARLEQALAARAGG